MFKKSKRSVRRKRIVRRRKPFNRKLIGANRTRREMLFLKSPGSISPDNYFAILNANDAAPLGLTGTTGPSGSQPSVVSYLGNGLINVDVWRELLLSTSIIDANGIDQLGLMYTKARVHGSKIKVQFINTGTDQFRVAVFPYLATQGIDVISNENYGVKTIPTMNDIIEQPYCKSAVLTSKDAMGRVTIVNYIGTKRMWGYKDISLNDDFSTSTSVGATTIQLPVNSWYWCIAVQSLNNNLTQNQVLADIKISYMSEFYDRKLLLNANDQ